MQNLGKVAIVAIIIACLYFASTSLNFLSVTFTPLSLSQVSYVSNDTTLNGPAWLGTVSANNGGQSFVGSWTSTSPEFSGVNLKPDPFSLTISQMNEYCSYPMLKTGQLVKTAWYKETSGYNPIGCIGGCFDPNNWCMTQNGGTYGGGSSDPVSSHYTYWCVGFNQVGQVGSFSNIAYNWNANILLTSQSGSVQGTIGGLGSQNSVALNDQTGKPVVWAKWAGNLINGQSCTDKAPITNILPVYNYNSQSWNIPDTSALSNYNTALASVQSCVNTATTTQGRQNCLTNTNAYANSLVSNWNTQNYWMYATVGNASTSTPYASLNLGLIQYPVIAFAIKAAWVGIYAPCATPAITQYNGSLTFIANHPITGTATVHDTTGVDSTYGATVTCPAGVSVTAIPNFQVSAGGSTQISYTVSASQAISGQCTLKVYNQNCPNNYDSKAFWVTATQDCGIQCSGGFTLNPATCHCDCNLVSTNPCQGVDRNNCVFTTIPNCGGGNTCTLSCIAPLRQNAQCTACECGLDPNSVPSGQFLNATACAYQTIPQGGDNTLFYIMIIGGIVLIAVAVLTSKKR